MIHFQQTLLRINANSNNIWDNLIHDKMHPTLSSPISSVCLHFSGSEENVSEIAASMTFPKI